MIYYELPRFQKGSLAREMLKLNNSNNEYPKDPMEAGIKNDIWYSAYQNLRNEILRLIQIYEGFATSNDPKSINRAVAEVLKSLVKIK